MACRGHPVVAFLLCLAVLVGCSSLSGEYADDPVQAFKRAEGYLSSSADAYEGASTVTVGRIDLGKKLFHDKRLSAAGDKSCGTCHDPAQGYTENNKAVSDGLDWRTAGRNAPTVLDVASRRSFFWDGRADTLEKQMVEPLTNKNEMANDSFEAVAARIREMSDYDRFFSYAFGEPASPQNIAQAIAAYQKTLVTGPNRFDLWFYEDKKKSLNENEIAGYELFVGKAGCNACHLIGARSAPFTDEKFHDTGYWKTKPDTYAEVDTGRYRVTGNREDLYAFRTPSLRNVALTGPYMHDGRLKTLKETVLFFNETGNLDLTDAEVDQLVDFLKALTSKKRPAA